jgi:hypothetical protein
MDETKTCYECEKTKPISEFTTKRGVATNLCKLCNAKKAHDYYHSHKKECSIKNAERHEKNKKVDNDRSKKYYQEHKPELTAYRKQWREENKAKDNGYRYGTRMRKYKKNPKAKIMDRMRINFNGYLHRAVSKDNYIPLKQRSGSVIEYLGCTPEFFIKHLESMWEPWMTWENYGNRRDCWSIDHIKPLSMFDPTKKGDLAIVWHYTNMRPISVIENSRKGAKLLEEYSDKEDVTTAGD